MEMNPPQRYCRYWGFAKPPFDSVPDPGMYFDLHRSVENAVAETIFAIEEENECLAVIVGEVGLGKTMALRVIMDALEPEKYRIAFVADPDKTFIQLMRDIIAQLTGAPCLESRREQVVALFNRLLLKTQAERKKVLIFIDEGDAMQAATLESLRLLADMQEGGENLFTIVMAGQLALARRLAHPKRADLCQRIGVYRQLTKLESLELMRDYIEHRLRRAGTSTRPFTDDAYEALWTCSEEGVPRLINSMAELALKVGHSRGAHLIDGATIHQVHARVGRVSKPIRPTRRKRTRPAGRLLRAALPSTPGRKPPRLRRPEEA
jgi:general secretion pathway protein A